MQDPTIATLIYVATAAGALAVALALPRRGVNLLPLGVIIGAAALLGFWYFLSGLGAGVESGVGTALTGLSATAFDFQYIFSAIAIGSALMVIANTRPVYGALWFVVIVIATAGLLLTLGAEFMAYAMTIIYGGAILVTYMFVLMLASQSKAPEAGSPHPGASAAEAGEDDQPLYDRVAWEPILGTCIGFVLLLSILTVIFDLDGVEPNPAAAMPPDSALIAAAGQRADSASEPIVGDTGMAADQRPILAFRRDPGLAGQLIDEGVEPELAAGEAVSISNSQRVGLDLFMGHPLGIELAGVILLVSLIGAVVIARRHVPDEDAAIRAERIAQAAGSRV